MSTACKKDIAVSAGIMAEEVVDESSLAREGEFPLDDVEECKALPLLLRGRWLGLLGE